MKILKKILKYIFIIYVLNLAVITYSLRSFIFNDFSITKIEVITNQDRKTKYNYQEISKTNLEKIIIKLFVINSYRGFDIWKMGPNSRYVLYNKNKNLEINLKKTNGNYCVIYQYQAYYPFFEFIGDWYFEDLSKYE